MGQRLRSSQKNPDGAISALCWSQKSALHPKREELPPEALHKCFIGRREMDTERDSDREATDRDTFSFRGGQTAMTRGNLGATRGWKSSHRASSPQQSSEQNPKGLSQGFGLLWGCWRSTG